MSLVDLLQWYNLIFLAPFAVAALMLAFSALQLGTDGDGDAEGGDTDVGDADVGGMGDGGADADADVDVDGDIDADGEADTDADADTIHSQQPTYVPDSADARRRGFARMPLLRLIGVGRAPMMVVFEAFCIGWGFFGFWANQLLLKTPEPTLTQLLPSFGIAFAGSVFCARGLSEVFARVMPSSETYVVSRSSLFGLTGRIVFPVTETTGRIRIYDDHGSLHDNPCRVRTGDKHIDKGRHALVVDIDAKGRLLVEEVPDSVR